ncbi:MAG TPA: hypothetical protein VEA99_01305 [Gemmatimonadaceae bacterium]|nr:hypothetical protein [Gemmatimonadaceae bacterium]
MFSPLLATALLLAPAQPATDTLATSGVTLVLGAGCASADTVRAESFVLETAEGSAGGGLLHLVRIPDARSDQLARRDGRALPARLEVDSAGTRLLTAWLSGVATRGYRLTAGAADPGLEAQRLGLEETLAQLRAEHAEATRALETVEALDRQRVTARVELPRARERVATLSLRLRMQEERLGALARSAARRRMLEERVTLAFAGLALAPPTDLGNCRAR